MFARLHNVMSSCLSSYQGAQHRIFFWSRHLPHTIGSQWRETRLGGGGEGLSADTCPAAGAVFRWHVERAGSAHKQDTKLQLRPDFGHTHTHTKTNCRG